MIQREYDLGELGILLLDAGESVTDVRDSLERVRATVEPDWGVEVAVLPSAVWVTRKPGPASFVQSAGEALSFRQAAHASRLVQRITASEIALSDVTAHITAIRSIPRRHLTEGWMLGSATIAGGLAVVFRCPWWTVLVALIVGGLVGVAARVLAATRNGTALSPFLLAFGATTLVGATASIEGFGPVPLFGVCAPIAVLVPGALVTNALLELTATDIVTGAARLAYGLMLLGFMSVGVAAGAAVTGMEIDADSAALVGEIGGVTGSSGWQAIPPFALSWVGVAGLAVGVGLVFGAGVRLTLLSVAMMTATFAVLTGASALVGSVIATGIAGATLFVAARILEHLPLAIPATVSFQPAFLLLVPGTVGLVALASMNPDSVATVVQTFVSLCLGTKTGALIAEVATSKYQAAQENS